MIYSFAQTFTSWKKYSIYFKGAINLYLFFSIITIFVYKIFWSKNITWITLCYLYFNIYMPRYQSKTLKVRRLNIGIFEKSTKNKTASRMINQNCQHRFIYATIIDGYARLIYFRLAHIWQNANLLISIYRYL